MKAGLTEEDLACIAASVAIAPALTSEQIATLRSVFAPGNGTSVALCSTREPKDHPT